MSSPTNPLIEMQAAQTAAFTRYQEDVNAANEQCKQLLGEAQQRFMESMAVAHKKIEPVTAQPPATPLEAPGVVPAAPPMPPGGGPAPVHDPFTPEANKHLADLIDGITRLNALVTGAQGG